MFDTGSWFGRDRQSWPIILLFLAALAPTLALLWLMNSAMQNERLATRERLSQAYQGHLNLSRESLEKFWSETIVRLEAIATNPAPVAFSQCVESGLVDGLVLFDAEGHVTYPNSPGKFPIPPPEEASAQAEANQLEYARKDFSGAARKYAALSESTNLHSSARALQAQVRCLVSAGRKDAALRIIADTLRQDKYKQCVDPQGRLIVANA